MKRRNPAAEAVRSPKYRPRVKESKKNYKRKDRFGQTLPDNAPPDENGARNGNTDRQ